MDACGQAPGVRLVPVCRGYSGEEGSKMKVTVQECIEKYNTEHLAAVIAAGQVVGFVQEG